MINNKNFFCPYINKYFLSAYVLGLILGARNTRFGTIMLSSLLTPIDLPLFSVC